MYCVQFIFETRELNEAFVTLDTIIEEAANELPGFIGKESWVSTDGGRRNAIYYWEDQESLKAFSNHAKHLDAKRRYQEWYSGFHVVISEVQKSYGDGAFRHITPNSRPYGNS